MRREVIAFSRVALVASCAILPTCNREAGSLPDAWRGSCFYELEIAAEDYRSIKSQAFSDLFRVLFDKAQADPDSAPPLVEDNLILFAESCDADRVETFVSQWIGVQQSSYSVRAISSDVYLMLYKDMGGGD